MAKEQHTIQLSQTGCAVGYVACNESRSRAAVMPGKISLSSDSERIFTNKNAADGVPMSDSILSYITDTFHAVRGAFSFCGSCLPHGQILLPISSFSLEIIFFSSLDMYDCEIPSLSATSF